MDDDRHQIKPYPLRIDEELRLFLELEAKKNKRSLNAEIAVRLEQSRSTVVDLQQLNTTLSNLDDKIDQIVQAVNK